MVQAQPPHSDAPPVQDAQDLAGSLGALFDPDGNTATLEPEETAPEILAICKALALGTGNDFSHYQSATLNRRIQRRIKATGVPGPVEYLILLQASPQERSALLKELLISVTSFFRDPEAFEGLRAHLLPILLAQTEGPLRIWVPGCASGEEAYSLAILIQEDLEALGSFRKVRIFATDLDAAALVQAKTGTYPPAALENLSPERRARFFTPEGTGHQIRSELRDMCVFSTQNILQDPPFSALHLISCRNLFIYLEPSVQAKLIPLFHFALNKGGLLFLGRSEGLTSHPQLFSPLDKINRIFKRTDGTIRPALEFPIGERRQKQRSTAMSVWGGARMGAPMSTLGLFEQMLMKDYLPASAIVNETGDVLYWAGRIGHFLNSAPNIPSHNLLTATSGPLHAGLRRLLELAAGPEGGIHQMVLHSEHGNGEERLRLTARPMPGLDHAARIFAVIIQEEEGPAAPVEAASNQDLDNPLLEQITQELLATRMELQLTVEELEATSEEFQASNEELQASNEELQASQEEMQAMNEELSTLNGELHQKVGELFKINGDLQSLMASTEIPTLFLDRNLHITRFTPSATVVYGLIPADLGRPLRHLVPQFVGVDLPTMAAGVLATQQEAQAQARSLDSTSWFMVRVRPCLDSEKQVVGVVATFVDCTEIRQAQMLAVENEAKFRNLFEDSQAVMLIINPEDGAIGSANAAAAAYYGRSIESLQAMFIHDINCLTHQQVMREMKRARKNGNRPLEFKHRLASGEIRDVAVFTSPVLQGGHPMLHSIVHDITDRKKAEAGLKESEERFRNVFEATPDAVWIRKSEGCFLEANAVAIERYGYSREEFRQMTPYDLVPPRLRVHLAQRIQDCLTSGLPAEWTHQKKDGTELTVELLLRGFTLHGDPCIYASARDITERKRAEADNQRLQAELQHLQKMESLGRLAGGVAHDMNNVLGAILAVTQALQARPAENLEWQDALTIVERAATRGRDLVKGLVAFARKDLSARDALDINLLVRQEVALLEHTLLKKVQVVMDLEEPLPLIQGETSALGSTLMNLCVNAVDAMCQGGTLTIRTRGLEGPVVQLIVEDTGEGMPDEVAKKAMEPFFTTKPQGQGTGLGLSMAFNTARAHGGTLEITSQEGKGTQVILTLPGAIGLESQPGASLPGPDPEA